MDKHHGGNFLTRDQSSAIKLKTNCSAYYQIQGALTLVGVTSCDLVITVGDDITVIPVERAETEGNHILERSSKFFLKYLLPNSVDEDL